MEKTNHKNNKKEAHKEEGAKAIIEEKRVMLKETELLKLKEEAQKANEYWERLLRLQADFENARKRWEREKESLSRFANEDLLCALLNVVDDLERSLELAQGKHEDFAAFLKGVEMILVHLHELLKKNGVSVIETKGKVFDPNLHEPLMEVVENNLPEHTVVEELQRGYFLNGKVIRTAKVKVSKKEEVRKDG